MFELSSEQIIGGFKMTIAFKLLLIGIFFFVMMLPACIIAIYERKYDEEN